MKSYKAVPSVFVVMFFACLLGTAQAASINLITNGDFTNNDTGWLHAGGSSGWHNGTEANPSPGGASEYTVGGSWLYQLPSVPLAAGQTYKLSFLAALLAGNGVPADETLLAQVHNGSPEQVYGSVTPRLTSTWQQYSFEFTPTAAASSYDVGLFNPSVNCTFGFDSVSLTAVPEPSTLVLVFVSIFGLLAYAWRKRK